MRMRRKKNLEDRLEACGEYLISAMSDDLNFETAKNTKEYLNFEKIFGNTNPVYLEIGCGKGQFACEIAKRNPQYNYLAVEKVANVIVSAAEMAQDDEIPNVRFMKSGAEYLERFIPDDSISGIYLNFSCPFPKKAYTNHRLTNRRFLAIYKNIMKSGAEIHQKTDNRAFFEYSLAELSDFGFTLKNVSLDLHNSDFEGNIVTEYENRFVSQGFPIYRLEAYLKEDLLVSECLLGVPCKYNGKGNSLYRLPELREKYNIIPVCPECLGGLPIPRDPAEIQGERVMTENGLDFTAQFESGARSALVLSQSFSCKLALLKENSPSCGFGTIYDGTFSHTVIPGNGITADLLSKNGVTIYNENNVDELLNNKSEAE